MTRPGRPDPDLYGGVVHPLEARSSPRVAASLAAQVVLAENSAPIACRLRDVGTGGACVQTPSQFGLAGLRRLVLYLPSGALTLQVEGCWQRATPLENAVLTGLRFVNLDLDSTKRVRQYVQETANDLTRFIQSCSEFSVLALDQAMDVVLFSRMREAAPGTYICREGAQRVGEDSIFVVMKGRVVLEAAGAREHELELEWVEPGGVFGGLPLITGVPSPLSAVASREVTLLEIDRDTYRYMERSKAQVAQDLARVVVAKNVGHLRAAISRLVSKR